MDKKITVKDVAREAGVSVATVSYIINNKAGQKISEATRKKVLQIANLLNYRPSHAAVSLATGKTNVIGIAYSTSRNAPSRNYEKNCFTNYLIEKMKGMKYDILYLPITNNDSSIITNSIIDAIIAIDLSHEQFKNLSEKYLVPIINVDMIIDDDLFYQIYTDYANLISSILQNDNEDYLVFVDFFTNEKLRRYIRNSLEDLLGKNHIVEVTTINQEIKNVLSSQNDKKIIVIGALLGLMILPYAQNSVKYIIASEETAKILPNTVSVIFDNVEKKVNQTMEILLNALSRNFSSNHNCKV